MLNDLVLPVSELGILGSKNYYMTASVWPGIFKQLIIIIDTKELRELSRKDFVDKLPLCLGETQNSQRE